MTANNPKISIASQTHIRIEKQFKLNHFMQTNTV